MNTPLSLFSLCTGFGGIDYAWSHLLGQKIAGQIEIDPYCQAVLQKQWPDVIKCSDIREVSHDDPFGAGNAALAFELKGAFYGTRTKFSF